MIKLPNTLKAWGSDNFKATLKSDIEALTANELPLQRGMSSGSYAMDDKIRAMIIGVAEKDDHLEAKAGIFYTGVIAGCNCADDPSPPDEQTEYCVVLLRIDKTTAETEIKLVDK